MNNTDNNQTATTNEVARATWVAPVLMLIKFVRNSYDKAMADFNKAVELNGLTSAIEWRAEAVAATEETLRQVAGIEEFINDMEHSIAKTDAEKATLIVRQIESKRATMIDCFRVPASTSAISNALESAKLEAKVKMFGDNGTFTAILKTIAAATK